MAFWTTYFHVGRVVEISSQKSNIGGPARDCYRLEVPGAVHKFLSESLNRRPKSHILKLPEALLCFHLSSTGQNVTRLTSMSCLSSPLSTNLSFLFSIVSVCVCATRSARSFYPRSFPPFGNENKRPILVDNFRVVLVGPTKTSANYFPPFPQFCVVWFGLTKIPLCVEKTQTKTVSVQPKSGICHDHVCENGRRWERKPFLFNTSVVRQRLFLLSQLGANWIAQLER